MAISQRITELPVLSAVDAADLLAIVDDPVGGPATKKITVDDLTALTIWTIISVSAHILFRG